MQPTNDKIKIYSGEYDQTPHYMENSSGQILQLPVLASRNELFWQFWIVTLPFKINNIKEQYTQISFVTKEQAKEICDRLLPQQRTSVPPEDIEQWVQDFLKEGEPNNGQ